MTVEVAEAALIDLLAALDAEAWDQVADRLDLDVQLADELTATWLRGRHSVAAYLRAQAGIVTNITSTPSSISTQMLGYEHALVTFNLRQTYRLDEEDRREQLTGTAILHVVDERPLLMLFHLGASDAPDDGPIKEEHHGHVIRSPAPVAPDVTEWSVGTEIRRRREAAGYSLRALAQRTGLSAGFLSQVERSLADPSVSSLRQIAKGLGVSTTGLLGIEQREPAGHRPGRQKDRARIFLGPAGMTIDAFTALPDGHLEAYIAEVGPEANVGPERRASKGEGFLYVLDGGMDLQFGETTTILGPGDGAHVQGASAHRISPRAGQALRYLTVQLRRVND